MKKVFKLLALLVVAFVPLIVLTACNVNGSLNFKVKDVELVRTSYVYDGTEKAIEVKQSSLPENIVIKGYAGEYKATNAGQYNATIKLAYVEGETELANIELELPWEITKANLNVDVSGVELNNTEFTYNATVQTVTVNEATIPQNYVVDRVEGAAALNAGDHLARIYLRYTGEGAQNYNPFPAIERPWYIADTINVATSDELVAALAAANAGEGLVININANLDVAQMITITKDVTINLNGHTLNAGTNNGNTKKIFEVIDDATLTIDGTTAGSTINGRINVGRATDNNGNLVINGGTYAVVGGQTVIHVNGECTNCSVEITDATITSASDNAIQFNGAGEYAIDGSTIIGYTGIYLKAGSLYVADSTITATGKLVQPTLYTNGSNATGDAIVMDTTAGYQGNMELYLYEGTMVEAYYGYALREAVVDGSVSETGARVISAENATLLGFTHLDAWLDELEDGSAEEDALRDEVSDGELALNLSDEFLSAAVEGENAQIVVYNVTLNQDVSEYLLGLKVFELYCRETETEGVYEVIERTVYEVATAAEYEAAFTNGESGMLIRLVADIYYPHIITDKDVVLDLNGHVLDAGLDNGYSYYALLIKNASLIILGDKEGSEIIGRIDVGVATNQSGTLMLLGGTYRAIGEQCVIHVNGTCTENNIVIMDAYIESELDNAIQFNGAGEYAIINSTIKGYTGIYMKAGTLMIDDSTIIGTGDTLKSIAVNHNGSNTTGDAIVLDSTVGYQGNMIIAFSGNTLVASRVGCAVREAIGDTTSSGTRMIMVDSGTFRGAEDTGAISISPEFITAVGNFQAFVMINEGAAFSNDISLCLPEGFITTHYDYVTGLYVVDAQ